MAKDFTSHGKKAVVDVHRGIAQHTNGFYNIASLMNLNLLIGNFDWKGGMIAASVFNVDGTGGTDKQPFNFKKMGPKGLKRFGTSIIRHDIKYEESTLFKGRNPIRPNGTGGRFPRMSTRRSCPRLPTAIPTRPRCFSPTWARPPTPCRRGIPKIEASLDLDKLPLYIASDILIGPTSMYADYIFPDFSYLERWEMQGSHPNMPAQVQPVRQPVLAPIPETVRVFGEEMPCCFETVILALAEKLGIKGYGKDGFGPGQDFTKQDDFYIRMVANVATDGSPVPDADDSGN